MNINNITIGEDKSKMDEQLIAEVQMHGVIYNRQKYYLNSIGCNTTGKFESKDEAWQIIAMKLGTDIDNCKKRWKYLRERYVSQRKQSDPPIYEHLSRPYLEKMKFLDQHIQPRKSYRNVPNFLTSPNANSSYGEYNMDSSRSNGSTKNHQYLNYHDNLGTAVKTEPDQALREFAAAVASQQLQQLGHPGASHHQNSHDHQQSPNNVQSNNTKSDTFINNSNYYEQFRENESGSGCIPSSSSSLKSPLSSPPTTTGDQNEILNNDNIKKPRVQISNSTLVEDSSDDHDDSINEDRLLNNSNRTIINNRQNASSGLNQLFPNNDFLLALYQQQQPLTNRQNIRSSEHLLGELVTSELLKMNKERRKSAQKRILEILFFDD